MKLFNNWSCLISKNITAILITLFLIRFIVGIIYSFYPVHTIHQWRQTDGLSVAMRYWLRWTVEHKEHGWKLLLPAVLNSGHTSGIVAMEFPFVNLITAPLFFFGNYWGRVLAGICFILLSYGLVWLNYKIWRYVYIGGVSVGLAVLLTPNFSFLNQYAVVFIPDFPAFMFVLLAVGISWKKPKIAYSLLFASLGILIKPPAVVVLALLFLNPNLNIQIFKNSITRSWLYKNCIWTLLSLVIAYLYYVPILSYIIHYIQPVPHFKVELQSPVMNLMEFWLPGNKWYYLFIEHLFSKYSVYLVIFTLIWLRYKNKLSIGWQIWMVLAIQIIIISAIDGFHLYIHSYYFECTSLIPAIIFIYAWKNSSNLLINCLFLLTLVINVVLQIPYELFVINENNLVYPTECSQIIKRNPSVPWKQGYVFQTDRYEIDTSPYIGLCFGEQVGFESAKYGIYRKDETIPPNCKIIDSTQNARLTKCND